MSKKEHLKVAVFAGSFDPFTLGHLDIVERASKLFDTLWVVVAQNTSKHGMFPSVSRAGFIKAAVAPFSNVKVALHEGLTIDFMKSVGATYLVRGVRGGNDLDLEQSVAWNNRTLSPEVETVLLLSAPEHLAVSSTVVRELLKCGAGSAAAKKKIVSKFLPKNIVDQVVQEFEKLQ